MMDVLVTSCLCFEDVLVAVLVPDGRTKRWDVMIRDKVVVVPESRRRH